MLPSSFPSQGVDPTAEQWDKILEVFLQKKHYAFFDSAYQGFATGDLDRDAGSMRVFAEKRVPMLVCQVRASLIIQIERGRD